MTCSLHVQPCRIQGRESAAGGCFQDGNAFGGLGAGQRCRDRAERDTITHHLLDLRFLLELPAL